MTAEAILRQLEEKEKARFYNEHRLSIMSLRLLLDALNIIRVPHSNFDSMMFIVHHSMYE